MDFVVVGLGLGALSILGGVVSLGWLAERWARLASRATTPDDRAYATAMAAARGGLGRALLGAGSAVLIATVGALAGSLDDRTGAYVVTTTVTVASLGLLIWTYRDRARHPSPPRRRPRKPVAEPRPPAARRVALPMLPDGRAAAASPTHNGAHDASHLNAAGETGLVRLVSLDEAPERALAIAAEPLAPQGAIAPNGSAEPGAASAAEEPAVVALASVSDTPASPPAPLDDDEEPPPPRR